MSRQRSGLLSGLVIGLITMLICTAGFGTAVNFMDRLPPSLRTFGDGIPLLAALAFVVGVLVGWAIRLVRPRSVLLSFFAALFAAAAVLAAMIALWALTVPTTGGSGALAWPASPQAFLGAVTSAAPEVLRLVYESWQMPAIMAAAALPAFVLVLSRALRLRRTGRHAAAEKPQRDPEETAEKEPEPEYRAPFEPLQPPKADPTATGSFFLPPDRGQA